MPEPVPERCKFCGKELRYLPITANDGTVIVYQPFPERCTCEQAQEFWRQHDAKIEAEGREAEDRQKKQRIAHALRLSQVPKRFLRRTFETFEERTPQLAANLRVAKGYAERFDDMRSRGVGLLLRGPNGTGKTHLAYAVALYLIEHDRARVICQTSADILAAISATFAHGASQTEREVMREYASVGLLVIDDLGKEHTSDWSTATIFSIINARYEAQAPTVITTNYTDDGLVKALSRGGDHETALAILSRLHDKDWMISLVVDGEDYRTAR